MSNKLESFDTAVIIFFRRHGDWMARIALFIIFFWFGFLKIPLLSPAGPLVVDLLDSTFLGFIHPDVFVRWFGVFEVIIGIMVLIPKLERITFALLAMHLFTTVMPLYVIPDVTWSAPLVPTLIGQYIIKNAALLALGVLLFARLRPMSQTHKIWGDEVKIT